MTPTYNLNKFLMVRPSILDTLKNYASLFFVYTNINETSIRPVRTYNY